MKAQHMLAATAAVLLLSVTTACSSTDGHPATGAEQTTTSDTPPSPVSSPSASPSRSGPASSTDMVGSWTLYAMTSNGLTITKAEADAQGQTIDWTLEIRPDGTFTTVRTTAAETQENQGTWTMTDGTITLTATTGASLYGTQEDGQLTLSSRGAATAPSFSPVFVRA